MISPLLQDYIFLALRLLREKQKKGFPAAMTFLQACAGRKAHPASPEEKSKQKCLAGCISSSHGCNAQDVIRTAGSQPCVLAAPPRPIPRQESKADRSMKHPDQDERKIFPPTQRRKRRLNQWVTPGRRMRSMMIPSSS